MLRCDTLVEIAEKKGSGETDLLILLNMAHFPPVDSGRPVRGKREQERTGGDVACGQAGEIGRRQQQAM